MGSKIIGGINFGGSRKNQNWREEILAVDEKFHFAREEIYSLKV